MWAAQNSQQKFHVYVMEFLVKDVSYMHGEGIVAQCPT